MSFICDNDEVNLRYITDITEVINTVTNRSPVAIPVSKTGREFFVSGLMGRYDFELRHGIHFMTYYKQDPNMFDTVYCMAYGYCDSADAIMHELAGTKIDDHLSKFLEWERRGCLD